MCEGSLTATRPQQIICSSTELFLLFFAHCFGLTGHLGLLYDSVSALINQHFTAAAAGRCFLSKYAQINPLYGLDSTKWLAFGLQEVREGKVKVKVIK